MGVYISTLAAHASRAISTALTHVTNTIFPPLLRHAANHLNKFTFHVLGAICSFTPGMFTVPMLSLLGFTALGSGVAAVQTATVPGGGAFAVLQSAAMGGYGAVVVAGAARAGVVAAEVANTVIRAALG
ncbi:hypothetical protein K432DRAFT_392045 [Lepidopterella palustris CBS 459.81]|uniref:Uncharacterized protein n=1 Tax=Lepidopterella palustris CBS 459.81 TaxID=1314670 RepID=A0A8E2JGF1_9PEZI|nr:hypothetical protein K432DRAFT_392045 [Lepidopterella palustris CBS 459.81]